MQPETNKAIATRTQIEAIEILRARVQQVTYRGARGRVFVLRVAPNQRKNGEDERT